MATGPGRRNEMLLRYLGAALFAATTVVTLSRLPFYPDWVVPIIVVAIAGLAIATPAAAAPAFVLACALPIARADATVGALALVFGMLIAWALRGRGGIGFLLVALTPVAVLVRAEWALAPLAGYLLGRRLGAGTAWTACALIIAAGLLAGHPSVGATVTGGHPPGLFILDRQAAPVSSLRWLGEAIARIAPGRLVDTVRAAENPGLLVLQPLVWAAASVVASAFRGPRARGRALVGVGLGVGFIAFVTIATARAIGGPVPMSVYVTVTTVSLAVALGVTAASEWFFPTLTTAVPARAESAVRTDDAEVDELLRLIASAEDQLATRHRTHAVVLITDIKSFSAMTEELGSVECAKIVQRHRDLLLPVIERHGGKGKSTGGDGLLAAFATPGDAVAAAVDMQRTLDDYCRSTDAPRELLIRVGLASGEVVLDSGGRPFLGAGLNLAARVMNLADGGRIMATAEVAAASGLPAGARHAHGTFALKNIATPVAVEEVLWHEGQAPQENLA